MKSRNGSKAGAWTLSKPIYTSVEVPIPDDFLAPLPDPSKITVSKIDFANTVLPEYKRCYAVVLDNVFSQQECDEVLRMAEKSAGLEQGDDLVTQSESDTTNGWRPALVNVGSGYEALSPDYRNSDRIIWDQKEVVSRMWQRVLQGEGMKEYFEVLQGKKYEPVLGTCAAGKWTATKQGMNERMRFLKYGSGQFFREHCDGAYQTPDGSERSFFTIHIYFNDSENEMSPEAIESAKAAGKLQHLLRGGATTFHSIRKDARLDVDPKAGRVLIFQHRSLMHSGDDVTQGIKYTMRSDLMYSVDLEDDVREIDHLIG